MNNLYCLKCICQILKEYMNLKENQIYIYNQKYILPNIKDCLISVGEQGEQIYSNQVEYKKLLNDKGEIEAIEESKLYKQLSVSIIIYSYDFTAMKRKDEILMAIKSNIGQRIQEENNFKIAITGNFNNQNELDGDKILYKYNLLLNCLIANNNITKNIDFYNKQDLILKVNY